MYQFTEDCIIGIEEIDREHRRLFDLINEAAELLALQSAAAAPVCRILAELKDYANTHFAHEEAYMEKTKDPELVLQRKEHAAFREKLAALLSASVTEDNAAEKLNEILIFLVRWLYRHILSSDMMIGRQPAAEDPFAFTDRYRTGIELIDREHMRLFEIIRDVNEVIHNNLLHDKFDEIMRLLDELRSYTEFHFADEENYMQKINYPDIEAQKRAHAAFVARLTEIDIDDLDSIDDNQQEYLQELIQFLGGWLINHILKMDKQIG